MAFQGFSCAENLRRLNFNEHAHDSEGEQIQNDRSPVKVNHRKLLPYCQSGDAPGEYSFRFHLTLTNSRWQASSYGCATAIISDILTFGCVLQGVRDARCS